MNIEEFKNFKNLPESYWIASTDDTDYPILEENIHADIIIVGGGIVGISCAYLLQNEGFKVALLESGKILQGITAHTTAKITSQHGLIYSKIQSQMGTELAKQYAMANETAIYEIGKIASENQILCDYIPQSAFVYTQEDKYVKKIMDEIEVASSLGIKASFVDELPFSMPIKAAIRFDHQAQFHPRKYLLSLANKIQDEGVQIYENSRAINLEEKDGNYMITTCTGKKITGKRVVMASHYPFYNKPKLYYARIYPERSYIIAVKAKEDYPGGMYINAEEPARSLRAQDSEDGQLIFVVGESHKTGQGEDTNKHYKSLINFANSLFTLEDIPFRWSTQDCMTLDGVPYVGHYSSNTPNMYVATGFGKWGMSNGMASAMIIRDLIVDGKSPWEDVYNPSRKSITASVKNFIVENVNVASQLLDGKISSFPKDIEVKSGEGKIVELDGKRAGAFRDESGELHLVNTTCPHMGCELNWNSAERSWDCPCHGSRFTYKGEIIHGPSIESLSFDKDANIIKKLFKEDF